jgi:uncharacterized damage-inducible protein DinB
MSSGDRGARDEHRMARATLEAAHETFLDNTENLTLDEALDAGGGYRSILGLMKHAAGWSIVYRSYAFDAEPKSWMQIDWPRGLRERIEPSEAYVREVRDWFARSAHDWISALDDAPDLAEPRPVHWGRTWPLRSIVAYIGAHSSYHAGEINAILAAHRGEAWEYGEHVEENHISTLGRSVRRPWITDEFAAQVELEMRAAAEDASRDRDPA